MISSNEFRGGMTFEMDGAVYQVIEAQHVKQGRGSAFVRTKIRNLMTGGVVNRTFRAGEKVASARIETRPMQYLYAADDQHFFMDTETFDQRPVSSDQLGEALQYLKENMTIELMTYEGLIIGAQLPAAVELQVTDTDPGVKGDTVSGGTKPAQLETGLTVQVPLFIERGELIRVDTRTGAYLERV
ncbi:MAG: elongation factor P [Thermaerobacterales bacterium]